MQASEDERVNEALWELAARYPGSKFSEDNHNAYLDELGKLPSDAVLWAIEQAPGESQRFMPSAPMLRAMAGRRANWLRSQQAQRTFEQMTQEKEKPVDHDQALQEFYRKCDEALAKDLGDEISADNKHLFFGIIAALGKVYGLKNSVVMGRERAEDPRERQGYARGFISAWRENGFEPHQVIHALRRAPGTFAKFPTEGMLRALIRDEPMGGFAVGWVYPDAGGAKPEQQEP